MCCRSLFYMYVFVLMRQRPPRSTRTDTLLPYTTLFRSAQAVALQSGAIRSALDLSVLEGRRNLKYTVQGSSAIQPSEITDNGQFNALRFPNQSELPAFFAVNPDGLERIGHFDVRDESVVNNGVFGQLSKEERRLGEAGVCRC